MRDDGITIPPRPVGHDYRVRLDHIGTALCWSAIEGPVGARRIIPVRAARCPEKARTTAGALAGAGWRVVSVHPLAK